MINLHEAIVWAYLLALAWAAFLLVLLCVGALALWRARKIHPAPRDNEQEETWDGLARNTQDPETDTNSTHVRRRRD